MCFTQYFLSQTGDTPLPLSSPDNYPGLPNTTESSHLHDISNNNHLHQFDNSKYLIKRLELCEQQLSVHVY